MLPESVHKRSPLRVWAVLAALILAHAGGNLLWLALDNHPILIDEDRHMLHARNAYSEMSGRPEDGRGPWQRTADTFFRASDFPPLAYFYGAAAIALLGPRPDALAFSTTPLFGLMLVGMFLLARGFLPPWEALFATFIASLVPLIYAFSHYFSVDYLAAAAVVWSALGFLRSAGFRRWSWSLVAGLGVAVCLLTRPPTLLCALPAACIALVQVWTLWRGDRRWAVLGNMFLTGAAALVPAVPWYVANFASFYGRWMVHHDAGGAVLHFPSTTANFGIFPFLVINLAMFLPMFLLALAGLLTLMLSPRFRSPAAWAVALWPWPMYVVLTVIFQQKEVRYAFPMLPALGLAAGAALIAVPWPRVRRVVCAVAAVILLAQYVTFTLGWSGPVVHGQYARVVMVEVPGVTFTAHEVDDVYYIGPNGLSLYRNAMLSDSYSYCPPTWGEHFLERLLNALVDDVNRNAGERERVALALVSQYDQIPGLSNLEFYNAHPGTFARTRWGDGPVAKAFMDVVAIVNVKDIEERGIDTVLAGCDVAGYVIFKFAADPEAIDWRRRMEHRGWRVVTQFWGEGYGQCRPGVYLLMSKIPEAHA